MTTPSKAQIEAAAKAIAAVEKNKDAFSISYEAFAVAALTAAQVGECKTCGGLGYLVGDAEWEPYAVQCPDCKAAAQVGEPTITVHAAEASAYLRDKAHKHEIAATIERCAQRLEQFYLNSEGKIRDADDLDDYIAAIRKLKDEP